MLTIDAPPEVVYALLKQMGQRRGGWYGCGGTRLVLRMRADGSETGFARWVHGTGR